MLEETKKFLKKEFGKGAEPNNDFCYALWEEKVLIIRHLIIDFFCWGTGIMGNAIFPEKKIRDLYKMNEQHIHKNPQKFFEEQHEKRFLHNDSGTLEALKLLVAPKYKTPYHPIGVALDAMLIDFYYSSLLPNMGFHSWYIDAKIDLALLNITRDHIGIMNELCKQITKTDQSKPGTIGKRQKAADAELNARTYVEELKLDLTTKAGRKAAISELMVKHTIDKKAEKGKYVNQGNSNKIAGITEKTARKYIDNIIKMKTGKAENQKE